MRGITILGLVLGCLMFSALAQAAVLLEDDFESGVIDDTVWGLTNGKSGAGPPVLVEDATLGWGVVFHNRPYLYTLAEFKPTDYVGGITIEGEFTFDAGPEGNLDVATRCDGVPDTGEYYMPMNGVDSEFYLHTTYTRTRTRVEGVTGNDEMFDHSPGFMMFGGETIRFTLHDDGSTVTGTLTDPEDYTHEFTFSDSTEFTVNHVMFAGDYANAGTRLEWIRISGGSGSVPLPGDANLDDIVNDADASILAAHWQQTGMGWGDGDFNDDQIVNDADASILAAHWQESQEGTAPVPEPSTLVLLAAGLMGLLILRRKK